MTNIRDGTEQHPISQLLARLDELPDSPTTASPEAIHRIRVAIKQTRAWLKLCHAISGDTPAYRLLVETLRQLGHALSGQRDRDVALATLASLARKYPGKKAHVVIELLRQQIAQGPVSMPDTASLKILIEQLRQELPAFIDVELPGETAVEVIDRAWIKMCKLAKTALDSEACADLHAWRKRVKSLTYQLALAKNSLPRQARQYVRLNKLGHRLGKVHDLCFLQTRVEEIAASRQPPLNLAPVLNRIQREQRRLIESSRKHYRRLCRPANHG